jgi:cysteine desulfurase
VFTWLRVDGQGVLDLGDFAHTCRDGLDLACVMAANNEIGTIAPMQEVGRIATAAGVAILCDATQAAGKSPLRRDEWGLTFMALSGHKMYGPKGVGALVVSPDSLIEPLIHGGGHERGFRSGTLNVPGIAGFGEACRLRRLEMNEDEPRIAFLRDRLYRLLLDTLPELVLNGDPTRRLAGNLHVSLPDVPNTAIVARLRDKVALSTGAACSSGVVAPSHVLRAIGLPANLIEGAIRLGIGRFTTNEEVEQAASLITEAVAQVRNVMKRAQLDQQTMA